MIGVSLMPTDRNYAPIARAQVGDDGEPFGVVELVEGGAPGWGTLNLGGLDVKGQVHYLLALARAVEALAHELANVPRVPADARNLGYTTDAD